MGAQLVLSGGHLKATLHKVSEPPEDQRHEQRLSLVLFNASKGNMRLKPIIGVNPNIITWIFTE